MSTDKSSLLRNALLGNGIFCSSSGLAFIIFAKPIADFLGLTASWVILALGAALVLYGIQVFTVARKKGIDEGFTRFVIGADIAWVIGSAVLIFTNLVAFTVPGRWAIAVVADIVLVFAILQFVGLRRMAN